MSKITLTWVDESADGVGLPTDVVHGFIHNQQLAKDVPIPPIAIRSAETLDVELPAGHLATHDYHCYVSFRRADGLEASPTQYLLVT